MFLCRISCWWSRAQHKYIQQNHINTTSDSNIIQTQYNKWRSSFLSVLLQYGLDLWEERNNFLHGSTPKQQNFIRRQKALTPAKALFQEGDDTVPVHQQKLFSNFSQRLDGSTRSIEHWIDILEVARKKREIELRNLAVQPNLFQYSFSQQSSQTQTI